MEPGIHRPGFAISLEPTIQNSVLLFAYQNPTYANWLLGHQWNDHLPLNVTLLHLDTGLIFRVPFIEDGFVEKFPDFAYLFTFQAEIGTHLTHEAEKDFFLSFSQFNKSPLADT